MEADYGAHWRIWLLDLCIHWSSLGSLDPNSQSLCVPPLLRPATVNIACPGLCCCFGPGWLGPAGCCCLLFTVLLFCSVIHPLKSRTLASALFSHHRTFLPNLPPPPSFIINTPTAIPSLLSSSSPIPLSKPHPSVSALSLPFSSIPRWTPWSVFPAETNHLGYSESCLQGCEIFPLASVASNASNLQTLPLLDSSPPRTTSASQSIRGY